MIAAEARRSLLDALTYAGVQGIRDAQWQQAFLEGTADALLDRLEIDSLAAMELCIAVEANTGVSMTPEVLWRMKTLGEIVALMTRA